MARRKKFFSKLLLLSLILDFIGMATYFVPGFGELADIFWAPIYSILIYRIYKENVFSIIAFTEEILPTTDFIPSATIFYIVDYYKLFK